MRPDKTHAMRLSSSRVPRLSPPRLQTLDLTPMLHYRHISLLLIAVAFFASCSDTPTGDPAEFWYRYNTAVVLEAGRITIQNPNQPTVSDRASATFHSPDSLGLYAGEVLFENLPLALHDTVFVRNGNSYPGRTYDLVSGQSTQIPLRLNGSLNTFMASGGPNAAALSVSAPSPLRELVATAPSYQQQLSHEQGFTVRWEPSVADSSLISLYVYSAAGGATFESQLFEPVLADGGSYFVDPRTLAGFPPGPILIELRRYRRTSGRLSDQRMYEAKVYSGVLMVAFLD